VIDPEFIESQATSHTSRVSLAKMPDKSFNPIQICLLGTQTVVLEPDLPPYLIQ
jgi:hypothetical protein